MIRRDILVGAPIVTAAASAPPIVEPGQSGLVGDGVADDAPAIQAALNRLGARGGGTLTLPPPKVHYRLASGLKLPSHTSLEGPAAVRYPYNASNTGACALVADFANPRQWVIEAATTTAGGRPVSFDGMVSGRLPEGVTYNCGVRNLLITSKNRIPFGGIRFQGCPGAMVDGVAVHRVGCGLLVNYSFGGSFSVHVQSAYYGVVVWDEANANNFEVYCARDVGQAATVPVDYRMPFLNQFRGSFADTLKFSSDEHGARPIGIICGSSQSTSTGNVFDAVVERYGGGVWLYNAYATDFRKCYLEGDAGVMACGVAASRSRFSMQTLHAYLSGTGMLFDFGTDVLAKIFGSGILHARSFGKPPEDDGTSLLMLEGIDPRVPGAPAQRGVRYAVANAPWTALALKGGWRALGADSLPAVRLDPWSHRVEFRGTMVAGQDGVCSLLPPECRPPSRGRYRVAGGQVEIGPDGTVRVEPDAGAVSLDGISYARW